MGEWQPIETAPKDGHPLDLWCVTASYRQPDCRWMVPDYPAHDWPRGKSDWCYYHGEWSEWVELKEEVSHWKRDEAPANG